MSVTPFKKKTYAAQGFDVKTMGVDFLMSGTLDGFVDFCVIPNKGRYRTYTITKNEAIKLISSLNGVVNDINKNCLYDNDCLLAKS